MNFCTIYSSFQFVLYEFSDKRSFASCKETNKSYGYPVTSVIKKLQHLDTAISDKPETFSCISFLLNKSKHQLQKTILMRPSKLFNFIQTHSKHFSKQSVDRKEYYIIFVDHYPCYT